MQDASTNDRLIEAALTLFGRDGHDATTTRAIAAAAGTNVSSIAYHFGGKAGLRLACADAVAQRLRRVSAVSLPSEVELSAPQARALLRDLMAGFTAFLTSDDAAHLVSFMLRELAEADSPALARLREHFIAPQHRALCLLWGAATGQDPDDRRVRLAVFALVGQAVYFRLAAPIVQDRMGWDGYPSGARADIAALLGNNLEALLEADHG